VVAGSMNKHFTKEAVVHKLQEKGVLLRAAPRGFNTDFGLPLAILGLSSGYNDPNGWRRVILSSPGVILKKLPKVLVLEFGISDPGDMQYLLSVIKPNITIITNINKRYIEGFRNIKELTNEYRCLLKSTLKNGLIVANTDNEIVQDVLKGIQNNVLRYGYNKQADYVIEKSLVNKDGQSVIIKNKVKREIFIPKFGKHHVYAALCALIVRDYFNENNKFNKKK